ncbi:MAG: acetyltransferase [Deltaproteobacteria bacterium]|nr:acetyltransferase [Deltaproteobacteria bacterium]MBW2051859.1 acetyltransferase [Deltaproteobacteria bacterium]MBW2323394.1 acetyltransferase [Deltaproteobacteria bacterium]
MRENLNQTPSQVILWGGFGQAKLVRPVIELQGGKIIAVFDDNPKTPPPFEEVPMYHGWDEFISWVEGKDCSALGFCLGINSKGRRRLELHEKLTQTGLTPVTAVHPSAVIAKDAVIGDGSQIMAGTIIGPEVEIGRQCIVNAKASVDHECVIGDGVEISPGATLCGMIRVGENAIISAGATVLPVVKIGADATVGAGAVVNKDVAPGTTVVGVPAKELSKNKRINSIANKEA